MKGIIDRFEGEYAVVELDNRHMINISIDRIPQDCKEGYAINIDGDKISIDWEGTERLRKEIEKLEEDLWN